MPADGGPTNGTPGKGNPEGKKNGNGSSAPGNDPHVNEGRSRRPRKGDAPPAEESTRTRGRARPYQPQYGDSVRKSAEERENSFHALAWLLEGATGLIEELRHNDLGLPEEFWMHAYAARREALLAMRAALDDLIEKSGAEEAKQQEQQKRRERRGGIDIEF